ncbi:iron chelate uptake ABC transporter family permease subunit [Actinomyces oris]|uniref:iron chelate uptake ABC transporter family permease subunit n=1 Tax=Actinomyces oris TaxID=544580 RepID=UPI0009D74C5D|nr:iron chelate uptake ABC transporter family permease subunit [Actinomyces oris]
MKADGRGDAPTDTAVSAYASYRRRTAWRVAMLMGLAALLLAVFLVALMVGPLGFSPAQVLGALFDADYDPWVANIVINLRLPPALLAVLVGGALSLAGVQMQTILDNPLAEPFTLGISVASALGAALAIVTGLVLPVATGAILLTAAHTASQLIVPGVAVPVGILTALVGVPVFLTIIFGRQRSAVRSGS